MKHICIAEFGTFLGVTDERLRVDHAGETIKEIPLSRIKTVTIAKKGVSFSSDLINTCAQRGIRFFFLDFKGVPCACLSGVHQHAVASIRRAQFKFFESTKVTDTAIGMIRGKIKNQRATLKYFSKYEAKKGNGETLDLLEASCALMDNYAKLLDKRPPENKWQSVVMGIEGKAADCYWKALMNGGLLPVSFKGREKRGARDVVNSALNYGYAILSSRVWNAVINAGLEPYAGILHSERPGKPSLVLDIMEEYRSWVVDRTIIKCRKLLSCSSTLDQKLKRRIIDEVQSVFAKKYLYRKRKLTLESILQRQVYRLAGVFSGDRNYKPFIFRW